jgi:oligopeptidase B
METTEIRYLDADKPESNFVLLYPRKEGIRLDLKHLNGVFYILSDENAANNKVMTVPVSTPAKENWQEYIPHRNDVLIESIDLFAN